MKLTLEKGQRLWFTSDTHYNHANICSATTKWTDPVTCREFKTLEHMNATLVNNINEFVGQDDILFHLGDWSFGGFEQIEIFRKQIARSGKKVLFVATKKQAKEILNDYASNLKVIFSSPWYHQLLTLFGLFAPRFLPNGKMKVLEGYFDNLTLGELKGNLLVPVYNIATNDLQIVKSWSSIRGGSHDNYLVKDLINGASSPPMLFPQWLFLLVVKIICLLIPQYF